MRISYWSSDMCSSDLQASQVGGIKAMPAVRALAKKLHVDLAQVKASGAEGVVTLKDVKQAAADGSAPLRQASAGAVAPASAQPARHGAEDRKSTRLNSSH